jgi:ubiquinone/menaquinone biosynthesis C-methylase UbiE
MKIYDEPFDLVQFFYVAMDRQLPTLLYNDSKIKLNVGPGVKKLIGYTDIDLPEWDAEIDKIPYGNDTVSTILATHFLEHINNIVGVLQEFQRVLAPGGLVNICVPYYKGSMAYQDLDHKHFSLKIHGGYYFKTNITTKIKLSGNLIYY